MAVCDRRCARSHVVSGTSWQLFAFQWVTHRDPRYFDEPDAFRPERWTPEKSEQLQKYAYFPFGGGPRQCIGNYFAMMEVVLLLATIGQRFRFTLDPSYTVEVLPVLSLRPKNGIKVIVEPRPSTDYTDSSA